MGLTLHQEEKHREALDILISQEGKRLLVKGPAGVGKTYFADTLIDSILKAGIFKPRQSFVAAAPTHKALAILKGKVSSNRINFETVHKVLKYRKFTDKKTGVESFKPDPYAKNMPLENVGLLVIDEASMIGGEMLGYLEKYAEITGTILVFIGDDRQINPVGEDDSPVFFQNYPTVELTEIVRQGKGNPIIALSRNIGAIWEYVTRMTSEGHGFCYTQDEERIVEELAKVNGTDELKYLAWSNPEVDRMNLMVRQKIYGTDPAKIELGETIVFDAPCDSSTGSFNTNEELKVEKLDIEWLKYNVVTMNKQGKFESTTTEMKTYIINGHQEDEWGDGHLVWKGILVIHEDSEKTFRGLMGRLAGNCAKALLEYETRNKFRDKFAQFKYNHAITVHKSQGSTYRQVILNVGNVSWNTNLKEKIRLFYTGITRASELLILYNT